MVTSVACAVGPSVTTFWTDFSFQNLVFLEFIWIFSSRNHFKINISLHSESKSYQINSIKSCSSRSFPPTPKAHSNSSETFRYDLIQFFSEEIIQYSRTFAPQVQMSWNLSSSRVFQRHQEHDLKHSGSVDLITTKQNKIPSFIDRRFIRVGLDRATLDFIKL